MEWTGASTSMHSVEAGPSNPTDLGTPEVYYINIRSTPLSTKREMSKLTPRCERVAPKQIRTAPTAKTINPNIIRDPSPKQITKEGSLLKMSSPHYNRKLSSTYFEQTFHSKELIGSGSFGNVFAARSYEDSTEYAVKVSINPLRINCPKKYSEVQNHMKANGHLNVVRLAKAWQEADRLYIQTERCDMSLFHYCSEKHELSESELWNILIDVVSAVNHLHQMDLIHNDIKPENIFLTKEFISKLGDFGLCIDLNKPHEVKTAEEGDSKYLASEVLEGTPTKASDVFSLGMTLLEAATDLALPSNGDSWQQIRNGVIPEEFFVGVHPDLRRMILSMIRPVAEERPTTAQLLEDPIVKKRIFERHVTIQLRTTREVLIRWLIVLLTWVMALMSVIFHYPIKLFEAVSERQSTIASKISKRPSTQQHTPNKTPEGTEAFVESLRARCSFDYSDDEEQTKSPKSCPPMYLRNAARRPIKMPKLDWDKLDD